ncbi:MAG: PAS domain S-box protein [Candidatus Zixiibacteriota bacterium]
MAKTNHLEEKVGQLERSLADHRRLERELRAAKEFNENLIETANAIVLTLDLDANITLFNRMAEQLTGYTKDEVIGRNWMELFIPDVVRGGVEKIFRDVVIGKAPITDYENPIITKSGEEKIIKWSNSIIYNSGRAPEGVLSIGVDVTEQWRARRELLSSEAKYRKVFEAANDVIFVFRGEEIIDCNSRTVEMFGYDKREEMIGLHPWEFSPEYQPDGQASRAKAEYLINEALSGRPQFFPWKHRRINGELFDAEVSLSSFQVAGDSYLLAVVRDVTERKRAETMLRSVVQGTSLTTGQEFFRSLVEHLAKGLGVSSALVAELHGGDETGVDTLAFYDRGEFRENITYALSGTPCAEIVKKALPFCFSDVQSSFPKGHLLKQLDIRVYLGAPLVTAEGEVMGIIAIMHHDAITEELVKQAESLLTIFASRAVAELQRLRAEQEVLGAKERLQAESEALSQKNIAMKEILEHIEKDRDQFREELSMKVENLLLPVVSKLRSHDGKLPAKDIDHLEDILKSILAREIDVFKRNLARLSGREIQICEMIRNGLSSKEIAEVLGISLDTVQKHRESIRDKLQIKRSQVNLTTYLRSRPWIS